MSTREVNEHRWSPTLDSRGKPRSTGYCGAPGCEWRGTRAAFYSQHLVRLVPKRGAAGR